MYFNMLKLLDLYLYTLNNLKCIKYLLLKNNKIFLILEVIYYVDAIGNFGDDLNSFMWHNLIPDLHKKNTNKKNSWRRLNY